MFCRSRWLRMLRHSHCILSSDHPGEMPSFYQKLFLCSLTEIKEKLQAQTQNQKSTASILTCFFGECPLSFLGVLARIKLCRLKLWRSKILIIFFISETWGESLWRRELNLCPPSSQIHTDQCPRRMLTLF